MSAISCSLDSLNSEAVSQIFILRTTKNDDTDRGGRHVIVALANTGENRKFCIKRTISFPTYVDHRIYVEILLNPPQFCTFMLKISCVD